MKRSTMQCLHFQINGNVLLFMYLETLTESGNNKWVIPTLTWILTQCTGWKRLIHGISQYFPLIKPTQKRKFIQPAIFHILPQWVNPPFCKKNSNFVCNICGNKSRPQIDYTYDSYMHNTTTGSIYSFENLQKEYILIYT